MAYTEIESDGYSVHIGNDAFDALSTLLESPAFEAADKLILADENTLEHCLSLLITKVPALKEAEVLEIESGEENKTIPVCYQLWKVLSEFETNRQAVLLNLGGGVIGDMGGFIASTYKRGIRFINVPTTLLAQVDASVGGKLGVDLDGLKNQVGVFNYPQGVFVIPTFLDTLPAEQVISGFAEIIKHALIQDADYWAKILALEGYSSEALAPLIERSIHIKNKIVLADPKEKGLRKLLNFGHTIGHAIETYALESQGRSLLHGEAIAIGMVCEAYLSHQKLGLSREALDQIRDFIYALYPAYEIDEVMHHRLIELMRNDKKNEQGEINFTLLTAIGEGVINQSCAPKEIIEALKYYRITSTQDA